MDRRSFLSSSLATGLISFLSSVGWINQGKEVWEGISDETKVLNDKWPVLKTYEGKYLAEVGMPLGGIGTGTVSLGGRGNLQDWEVMNRGALGWTPGFKLVEPTIANGPFFAIYYEDEKHEKQIRVLEGPVAKRNYYGDWGADVFNAGFPRFEKTTFATAYPLAQVSFSHKEVPLEIRLEAFNPLIPGDEEKSGLPVAVLRYGVTNPTDRIIEAGIVGMVPNFIGADGWDGEPKGNINEYRTGKSIKGVFLHSEGVDPKHTNWGTMALSTTATAGVSYRTSWAKLGWNWTFREFWDDFIADGELTDHPDTPEEKLKTPPATLAVKSKIRPGETKTFTFLLTWHFPNRRGWDHGKGNQPPTDNEDQEGYWTKDIVGNYYTTQYKDAWNVAEEIAPQLKKLEEETVRFVDAFVKSDLPSVIKEAALFNLNNLRSQTVFRTKEGYPFGWEGTGSVNGTKLGAAKSPGWGFGTCFHVWNYESTVPFLFGDLAMKFREVEFRYATHENGAMSHRVGLPLEKKAKSFKRWAADGQMGTLIKMYRDWQLSGDDEKLREMWPNIKKAISFAWSGGIWDIDKDGVMEGSQHNTMDIEYFGPNPQMAGWYLGALRAAEEMALYLNDEAFARECRALYKRGRKWVDAHLFNGEYYEQIIPEDSSKVAQLGKGNLVDQLVGQYLAHTAGLGYVLDQNHVQTTLKSIMKYNFIKGFNDHMNTFRSFALGDEAGLLMATYPHGDLLDFPFPYYTEVMTGFEYSTAAHMIYEGQMENGIKVYKAIRDRFDGYKRNPFNEGEFGHRYARAMAAWAGVLAYTGFQYSAIDKSMTFNPKEGKYFWSNGYQYGTVEVKDQNQNKTVKITPLAGEISLKTFSLNGYGTTKFKEIKTFPKDEELGFVVTPNDPQAGLPINEKLK